MKKLLGLFAFTSILALQAGVASASCYVANGQNYCTHTSDGAKQPYKPSSFQVTTVGQGTRTAHTNAERAVQAAQRRRQHLY